MGVGRGVVKNERAQLEAILAHFALIGLGKNLKSTALKIIIRW